MTHAVFCCCRSYSAVFGEAASDWLGADVASDSRAGANEHALHLARRPGQLHDSSAVIKPGLFILICHIWPVFTFLMENAFHFNNEPR